MAWGVMHVRSPARQRAKCLACGERYDSVFFAGALPRCRRCVAAGKPIDLTLRRPAR